MNVIQWVEENWVQVLAIVGGLHAIAKVIVAWTPTPKDDAVLGKVVDFALRLVKVFGLQPKGK